MANASLFHKIDTQTRKTVTFSFEGKTVEAFEGESVAASLLAAGLRSTRDSTVSGQKRAPLCMMGVCFECLMEIDGQQNKQSCMTPVKEGMVIKRQIGARKVGADDE